MAESKSSKTHRLLEEDITKVDLILEDRYNISEVVYNEACAEKYRLVLKYRKWFGRVC